MPPLDYATRIRPQEFLLALETNRTEELQHLIGRHDGRLKLTDGSDHVIAYGDVGGVMKLSMTRVPTQGEWRPTVLLRSALENLGCTDVGRIKASLANVAGMANQIADRLRAALPDIVRGQWNADLAQALVNPPVRLDAREVLPWLDSPERNGCLRQDGLVPGSVSKADGVLTAVFKIGKHRQKLQFRKYDGGEAEERQRAERDLARMERVLNGHYADRFGRFANARDMMAVFMAATVVEEATAEMAAVTDGLLPAEGRAESVPFLPWRADGEGQVPETRLAADMAMRACRADVLRAAEAAMSRFALPREAAQVEERSVLDTYTNRALAGIHQCLSTRLHKHERAAFCASVRNEFGVSDADAKIIRKRHREFGNDTALRLDGAVGKRQVLIRPNEPSPPGTDVARFFVKLGFGERLWRTLRGTPPSRLKEADVPPSNSAVVGTQQSFAPRRLCKLWVNKFPPCLRFHPGGARLQGSSDMAAVAASRKYTGLDSLSRDLFQTVHDNRMHEVVADVRQEVDKHAAAMRIKGREQLHAQLAADSRLARVDALCGSGENAFPPPLREAIHHAFDAAAACDAFLGGDAPLTVSHRDELQAAFSAGLNGQPLPPVVAAPRMREARSMAHKAGLAAFAALASEAGQQQADGFAYALHGAFGEGLRRPAFLDRREAMTHLSELPLTRAQTIEFGRKLIGLAEAHHQARRAADFDNAMRPRIEAWERLVEAGGASLENGRLKAMQTAVAAGADARAQRGAAQKRVGILISGIEGWCRDEGVPVQTATLFMQAIGEAMGVRPPLDGEVPGADASERKAYTHARGAAQAILANVSEVEAVLDRRDRALRERLDLTVIGRATLGEFNRWTKGEIDFAWSLAGAANGGPRANPAPDANAVQAEAVRNVNAPGPVEFDSEEAGVTHHLARLLNGLDDPAPGAADEGAAASAPQAAQPPVAPASGGQPLEQLEEVHGIYRGKGIENLSRDVIRRTHSMPAALGGRRRPE